MMKRITVVLCAGVMLGSAGSVLANGHKASICHNGSTYNSDTQMEDPISFVITIAGREIARAVEKHMVNHGDSDTYVENGLGEECELVDDGTGTMIVECNEVILCEPAL